MEFGSPRKLFESSTNFTIGCCRLRRSRRYFLVTNLLILDGVEESRSRSFKSAEDIASSLYAINVFSFLENPVDIVRCQPWRSLLEGEIRPALTTESGNKE